MHMRQEAPPLSGRDHLAYRSSYAAARDVVDGDLCEQFGALPPAVQRRVAEDMERTPVEVLKKLEDLRARIV
jgi:splicing factor 3B subunit 3